MRWKCVGCVGQLGEREQMRLIDAETYEKQLWLEFNRVKNEHISTGISIALGILNDAPTVQAESIRDKNIESESK